MRIVTVLPRQILTEGPAHRSEPALRGVSLFFKTRGPVAAALRQRQRRATQRTHVTAWQTNITCIEVDFREMQMHHQAASVCSSGVTAEHKSNHAHIDALARGRVHIIMNDPEVIIPPNPNFSSASSPSPSSSSSKPEDIIMKEPTITKLNRVDPPERACQSTGSYDFLRKTRSPFSLAHFKQRGQDLETGDRFMTQGLTKRKRFGCNTYIATPSCAQRC